MPTPSTSNILFTQMIATFGFSLYFPHVLSFFETQAILYLCRCKKFSPWCCAPSYLDYLHVHCSHLTSPDVLSLPLSGSIFSTDYTFFVARFIISQRASIYQFTRFSSSFPSLVPFAGLCHVPGFSCSPFFSQCSLLALVLLFASQMFPHGCCAWGCLFIWRICLCTDLSEY